MPASDRAADPVDQALGLILRYQHHTDRAALDRAETLLWSVVGAGPPFSDPRVDALLVLSDLLALRGWESADPAMLDNAVEVGRWTAGLVPAGDPLWPLAQAHLSWALSKRFDSSRRLPDVDAAVRHAAAAVSRVQPDDPQLATILIKTWFAYQASFDRTGRLADIDEAVRIARLAGLSTDPDNALASLSCLSGSLMSRFGATGNAADIDEAVRLGRAALAEMPAGHFDRGAVRANLALALANRHLRGDGPATDLIEAAQVSRELIATLPQEAPLRSQLLANHAVMLFGQEVSGDTTGPIAEAVRYARAAVEATGGDRRARHQANLANFLLYQARTGKDPAGVGAAIDIGRTALAGLSPGNPDRVRALNILASALRVRHMITRDPADLDAAAGMWRSAVGSAVGPVVVRMNAARAWADAAAKYGGAEPALEAYAAAVGLLPLFAWRGLDRTVQEKRLSSVAGLAGDAAAWALAAGQPERAVELLEHGRQVLWSQAVQTRSDLSALAAVAPELAAGLDEIRRELDGGGAASVLRAPAGDPVLELQLQVLAATSTAGAVLPPTGDADRRRRLAERWEQLLAEARRQPGFADFLTAPTFATLREAAAGGPVVIVNTSRWRSDALIVTTGGVQQVPLPWLDQETAQRRANALLAAQREVERGRGPVAQAALRQTLATTQRWLWDTVAEPVLDALAEPGPDRPGTGPDRPGAGQGRSGAGPDRPRVWWCPTGPLTMLPLHAAGRFGAAEPLASRRRLSVPARCVSSYTPSLGALLRARSGPPPERPPRVFAVGAGHIPGQPSLPAVSDELHALSTSLAGVRLLIGAGATTAAVLAALGRHSWAHFACHADQDLDHPSASSLRLADGRLSVLELASSLSTVARPADLAYLSACRTAAGARDLPDEAIHLTAALQFGGFRHVIGSQWAVADRIAAQVAGDVYAQLAADGEPDAGAAAYALDLALARVRREHPDRPDLWAALIHTGP
jgi:hypothetical protein